MRLLLGFGRYLNTSVDREYVEALEQEMRERDRQTVLGQLLSEANQVVSLSRLCPLYLVLIHLWPRT